MSFQLNDRDSLSANIGQRTAACRAFGHCSLRVSLC